MIVTNCTFSGNTADYGGGISTNFFFPSVTNCVLWGNSPDEISASAGFAVSYSDVGGGYAGVGNIDADPLFVDPDSDDLRLQAGSPCIDAGDSGAMPLPVDFDGNPRGVDDFSVPDTGIPVFGLTADMGAYEFQAGQCPADFNGDGDVNADDLAQLLGSWGPCD